MTELNKNGIGLALGIIFAILHLLWIIAVAGGFAGSILSWWNSTHFINTAFSISPFDTKTALITLIRAFVGGYIFGWLFSLIYNKIQGGKK